MTLPTSDIRVRFGRAIRDARLRQRLTQEQLAERSGLSYKFVGEVERGRGNPTLITMARLAGALGIGLAALVDSPDPPKTAPEYTVSKRELQAARESLATVAAFFSQIASPPYRRRRRTAAKR